MDITPDIVDTSSLTKETKKMNGRFILDKHLFPVDDKLQGHWDIKYSVDDEVVVELSFWSDPSVGIGSYETIRREYEDEEWNQVRQELTEVDSYGVKSHIQTLDSGDIEILDNNDVMTVTFNGSRLNGKYKLEKTDGMCTLSKQTGAYDIDLDEDPDKLSLWIEVNMVDVPGREIHCSILTPYGKEQSILGVFSDEIAKSFLDSYSKGEKIFLVRLYRGFIVQIASTGQKAT